MSSKYNDVLYIGVTGDLHHRVWEHKQHLYPKSFTKRYNVDKLVYYEEFSEIDNAIHREKQLKNWKREWKDELIDRKNP